jgi:hypothetical protein
MRFGYQL